MNQDALREWCLVELPNSENELLLQTKDPEHVKILSSLSCLQNPKDYKPQFKFLHLSLLAATLLSLTMCCALVFPYSWCPGGSNEVPVSCGGFYGCVPAIPTFISLLHLPQVLVLYTLRFPDYLLSLTLVKYQVSEAYITNQI